MTKPLNPASELRGLAEAATPGPWTVEEGDYSLCYVAGNHKGDLHDAVAEMVIPDDAAYIAAANPQAILGLLDRIAELEAERAVLETWHRLYMKAADAVDALKAENEQLRSLNPPDEQS